LLFHVFNFNKMNKLCSAIFTVQINQIKKM